MATLTLADILKPGAVITPVKFDVTDDKIKRIVETVNKNQDELIRLKEIDKERLKLVVQL